MKKEKQPQSQIWLAGLSKLNNGGVLGSTQCAKYCGPHKRNPTYLNNGRNRQEFSLNPMLRQVSLICFQCKKFAFILCFKAKFYAPFVFKWMKIVPHYRICLFYTRKIITKMTWTNKVYWYVFFYNWTSST